MMKKMKIWNESWCQQMSFIFFLMLCVAMPWGTRLQFENQWTWYGGQFNEYLTYFVYLSAILLGLVLLFWWLDMMIKFWRDGDWDDWTVSPWSALTIIFLTLLTGWAWYSFLWAPVRDVTLFRAGELTGVWGMASYIVLVIKNDQSRWTKIVYALLFGLLIQVGWGLGQYVVQHDFGWWWLGESILGPLVEGVAKVDVGGGKLIRAYGSLPHANIYGFYLWGWSAILSAYFLNGKNKWWTKFFGDQKWWKYGLLGMTIALVLLGILVSFSRTIWVASVLVLVGIILDGWQNKRLNSWITKWNKWDKQKIAGLFFILTVAVGVALNWQVIAVRGEVDQLGQDISVNTRKIYDEAANVMIEKRYYNGFGMGNFVYVLPYVSKNELASWMYQPVHNTFKLIWAEIGVLGFLGYSLMWLALLGGIWSRNGVGRWQALAIWMALIWLLLFDHYMWDIWQGELMFALLIGWLMVTNEQNERKKSDD